MTGRSCIETLNARTCFWPKMACSNSAIWTWARWPSAAFFKLKPVRPTMLALKFGRTSPMITRATFGAWAACCMRFALSNLLSQPKIWISFSSEYVRGASRRYHHLTPKTSCTWSNSACRLTPSWGPRVLICSRDSKSNEICRASSHYSLMVTRTWIWFARFMSLITLVRSQNVCQLPTIRAVRETWTDRPRLP